MSRGRIVGFDRKLELVWLDAAAGQVAQGTSPDEVRKYLWNLLEGSVSDGGQSWNSDRGKTITVLAHIWSEVPERAVSTRDRALTLLSESGPEERVALHWAMCLATYPFFGDVAETVGKMLSLQDTVALAEIRQRMAEKWGDRVITKNATQRIVRGFVAWGALKRLRQTRRLRTTSCTDDHQDRYCRDLDRRPSSVGRRRNSPHQPGPESPSAVPIRSGHIRRTHSELEEIPGRSTWIGYGDGEVERRGQ